jgi:long-subunit acyl-CoA synthetase (AMP-forming)
MLREEANRLADELRAAQTRVLATLMDNSPAWVVADLAAAEADVVHLPLPLFFTPAQMAHALRLSGADTLLAAPESACASWLPATQQAVTVAGQEFLLMRLQASPPPRMPADTAKISFTSGTTGEPKGVCLTAAGMRRVADGLAHAMAPLGIRRHLCALPFPVLLENIAGLLAPMSQGATCVVLPLRELGLSGSSSFDPARFQEAVARHQPHSVILLPQMLRAWTGHLMRQGARAPASLKIVAVGGAAVGAPLIAAARAVGIPAYEGYGLSEGSSVQTLNLPGADQPGSAGRPLPHAAVRVTEEGELQIAGSLFAGYLGEGGSTPEWWPTGDLGTIDADGFVHVHGRSKNVLITAYGRNVSPEWVETTLRSEPAIAQAVVYGDGQPALSAVLWLTQPDMPDHVLAAAVAQANPTLPDYARVGHWVRARAPFDAGSGLATPNGRPRRQAILQMHADALLPTEPAPVVTESR